MDSNVVVYDDPVCDLLSHQTDHMTSHEYVDYLNKELGLVYVATNNKHDFTFTYTVTNMKTYQLAKLKHGI